MRLGGNALVPRRYYRTVLEVPCRMSPGYQPEGPDYGRAFDRLRNGLSQILLVGGSW